MFPLHDFTLSALTQSEDGWFDEGYPFHTRITRINVNTTATSSLRGLVDIRCRISTLGEEEASLLRSPSRSKVHVHLDFRLAQGRRRITRHGAFERKQVIYVGRSL